ncbi:MAG TPA: hypothetical protein VET85_18145 [Stellaceae bacterium]|nr:hypothetical protein [Stellaceae bacterium]
MPCVALLATLAACSFFHEKEKPIDPSSRLLYSPNGEPLNGGPLGRPKCRDALARWFDRVDADRDGSIERNEFIADARRQFAAMDLNRDGVLTPAALAKYRLPYAGTPAEETSDEKPGKPAIVTGGPDPVMAADTGLRNKVELGDFLAHAEHVFATLDANHDSRLSRAEVQALCTVPGE